MTIHLTDSAEGHLIRFSHLRPAPSVGELGPLDLCDRFPRLTFIVSYECAFTGCRAQGAIIHIGPDSYRRKTNEHRPESRSTAQIT